MVILQGVRTLKKKYSKTKKPWVKKVLFLSDFKELIVIVCAGTIVYVCSGMPKEGPVDNVSIFCVQ